jgi:putative transposase
MKKRSTEEQIIGIREEAHAGVVVADVCGKHRILDATYYNCKAKFGRMNVSEAQRLKILEAENAKRKRLLADGLLDNAALKDVVSRNW